MTKWISVKDRLPEVEYEEQEDCVVEFRIPKKIHYLVFVKGLFGFDQFQIAFRTELYHFNRLGEFNDNKFQWWLIGMEKNIPESEFLRYRKKDPKIIEITHWMPLPELPEIE